MTESRRYVPAYGARITKDEAKLIGEGIDLVLKKFGRAPHLVEKFAEAVKSKSNPAYPVWRKKYEEFKKGAARAAADYCFRSVDIYVVTSKGHETGPHKALFLLEVQKPERKDSDEAPEPRQYVLHTRDMMKEDPKAIDQYEEDFRRRINTAFVDFADIAGNARTRRVVLDELDKVQGLGAAD